ncbi:hypothetical protein Y032_0002g1075 [Ancylostoma ceylanicum]|uniref:Uncharacterized protein n=1 Tax=Ancylostoma ceylanicum TaxID=53326 RepID=A0A016VZI7_9BILA|nr:hypothetical protein Y032_0002g1075 [Ancylostoma ceylanicum]
MCVNNCCNPILTAYQLSILITCVFAPVKPVVYQCLPNSTKRADYQRETTHRPTAMQCCAEQKADVEEEHHTNQPLRSNWSAIDGNYLLRDQS